MVTAAWAGLLFAAFRPGLMSIDSLVQYGQGLAHAYSNQHPPFGSFLFGLAGALAGTPAPLLAVQLALVGGGFALLAVPAARRHGAAAVALTLVFLAVPSTWALAVALWKDVLLAGVLLVACAALRAGWTFATLALLLVASLLRHDALFATAPLAVGAAWTSPALRGRARGAVALLALVAFAAAPRVADRATRARDVWPVGQLFVYDLAGIYVRHPEAFPASSLARDLRLEDLRQLYTPFTGGPLLFPARPGDPGISFHGLAGRRALAGEWVRALLAHPGAYLAHRWAAFRALLGWHGGPAFAPYHDRLEPNRWQLRLAGGPAYVALARFRDAVRDGPVFRGWLWLALAAIAMLAAAARRAATPFWIAASGVCYALSHLGTAVSAEFRYLYWTALSPFAAAAAALALRSTAHWASPPTIATRRSAK